MITSNSMWWNVYTEACTARCPSVSLSLRILPLQLRSDSYCSINHCSTILSPDSTENKWYDWVIREMKRWSDPFAGQQGAWWCCHELAGLFSHFVQLSVCVCVCVCVDVLYVRDAFWDDSVSEAENASECVQYVWDHVDCACVNMCLFEGKWETTDEFVFDYRTVVRLNLNWYHTSACVWFEVCVCICVDWMPLVLLRFFMCSSADSVQCNKNPITQPGLCLPLHMATDSLACPPRPLPLWKAIVWNV